MIKDKLYNFCIKWYHVTYSSFCIQHNNPSAIHRDRSWKDGSIRLQQQLDRCES